jgi:hypothetical protein
MRPRFLVRPLALKRAVVIRAEVDATDLKDVDKFQFDFDLGKPFKPFEQLMGVLPDLSSAIVPEAYRVRLQTQFFSVLLGF